MRMKRIAALAAASCMTLLLCSCGTNTDNTVLESNTPTMEQIYAANTLHAYEQSQIQPSLSTCLREGPENKESNALLTVYHDDALGLVSRIRAEDMQFQYYFNKDGTDFYCVQDEDENVTLTIQSDTSSQTAGQMSYPEYLFEQNKFGAYDERETMVSCTDSGDTYHIVTDISALSHTDGDGRTYTYTTQEYDVEKETLRILALFRTYKTTDRNGMTQDATFSRCMTYSRQIISLPKFILENIEQADWSRRITLVSADSTKTILVPRNVSVLVETPDGYEAYTDSAHTQTYHEDTDETYADRTIYIGEV